MIGLYHISDKLVKSKQEILLKYPQSPGQPHEKIKKIY